MTEQRYNETRTFDSDKQMEILGVPGRLTRRTVRGNVVGTWLHQEWRSQGRKIRYNNRACTIVVKLSFDDECGNRRNDFSITGEITYDVKPAGHYDRDAAGGCIHQDIAKHFPELAGLVKWHLMFTDGPMGYPANPLYHAGDKDCWGLRLGEKRQMMAKGEVPMWNLRADATGCSLKTPLSEDEDITNLPLYRLQDLRCTAEMPQALPRLYWEPCWRVGEGKVRELALARSSAVWPEATDEQLCLPKAELEALLMARLPGLIEEFRADMKRCGFYWSPEEFDAQQGS